MARKHKNQHEWGVIAQVFTPEGWYQLEVEYCGLCGQYKAHGDGQGERRIQTDWKARP